MHRPKGLLISAAMLAAPVSAQVSTHVPLRDGQGPFSALPLAVSRPASSGTAEALIKNTGGQTSPPSAWSSNSHPAQPNGETYDFLSMMAGVDSNIPRHLIDLDALSTGQDVIPNQDSSPNVPDGTPNVQGFMAYSVTLSAPSNGQVGSVVRQRYNTNGGASGADVFTYISTGSTGIAAQHVNRTYVNTTQRDMGFAGPGGAGPEERLDAIDWGMGVITNDPPNGSSSAVIFPTEPGDLYFSLSYASAAAINALPAHAQFGPPEFVPGIDGANCAHIYKVEWNVPGGYWEAPTIYVDAADLGLTPNSHPDHDLDAVAVYHPNRTVLFSTDSEDFNEIMFYQHVAGDVVGPAPARTPGPDFLLITDQLGLDDEVTGDHDDIDGICIADPEHRKLDARVGTPMILYPPINAIDANPLSLSMARGFSANDDGSFDDVIVLQTTGIPRTATDSPLLEYVRGLSQFGPPPLVNYGDEFEGTPMGLPLPDPSDSLYGWSSLHAVPHWGGSHELRFVSNDQGLSPDCVYVRHIVPGSIHTSPVNGFQSGN